MYLRRDTINVCVVVFIVIAVGLIQVVAGSEDVRNSEKILNRNRRQEEDTFNYVGLWISIGIFLAFDGMIVAFGIYKSYFGEIHMPVKREDLAPKVQNGKVNDKKKEGEAELTAVNPTFIDDEGNHASTQTDFPDESEKKEGALSSKETPVIYTV